MISCVISLSVIARLSSGKEFNTEDTENCGENHCQPESMLLTPLHACRKRRAESRKFLRASHMPSRRRRCGASGFPYLAPLCAELRDGARLRHSTVRNAISLVAWLAARARIHRCAGFRWAFL